MNQKWFEKVTYYNITFFLGMQNYLEHRGTIKLADLLFFSFSRNAQKILYNLLQGCNFSRASNDTFESHLCSLLSGTCLSQINPSNDLPQFIVHFKKLAVKVNNDFKENSPFNISCLIVLFFM